MPGVHRSQQEPMSTLNVQSNQPWYRLFIAGSESDLQVLAFTGREALNQPFAFELELISDKPPADLNSLLHQLAFLETSNDGAGFHGQIYSLRCSETGGRLTRYTASLRPRLAYLAHRINQRIFQHMSVPQIIARVLEDHGILDGAYSFRLCGPYPERDYCVQYGESDLDFVHRLCEEEGIHYHFQHSASAHMLVFGDHPSAFPELPPLDFHFASGLCPDAPFVHEFGVRLATRTTRVTRRDYDCAQPARVLESEAAVAAASQPELEDYDYPGRFTERQRGERLAARALERHRSDYQVAQGQSDQALLVCGHAFALRLHSVQAWNTSWLLTEVQHEGKQPQVLKAYAGAQSPDHRQGFSQGYRNRFSAIERDTPFRPPLDHPKPKVLGSQSAVVTGPAGEEIYCDDLGRVKVRFFWDRDKGPAEHSSCWIRVASNWAGQQMGALTLPRVGMEVLVSFLEGDPDQPVISGCLYNGTHLPAYKLPDHKTLSMLKSHEYKGSRSNELRIDDTTGQISVALRSDHGASALNLGYLTHPRPSGGEPRGEGFELRTDHHGAIRAGSGLLITTHSRTNAAKHHKDLPETSERLKVASDQQQGFSDQARHCLAQESGDQDVVAQALHLQHAGIIGTGAGNPSAGRSPEFSEPHLVMASPSGIALTTSGSTHVATGEHLALSSTGHTSLSIGKRLLASASQGMRLFVQNLGWRLIVGSGDIDIRALKNSIKLLAELDITASAERITLSARTELKIQGGGSSSTWNAAGITHATGGPHTVSAANFVWAGAKSSTASFPEPPKSGQGNLELFHRYANRRGIVGAYEVTDALGKVFKGTLGPYGSARVSGAAPGPATVRFGPDTTDPWAASSHVATAVWPPRTPDPTDVPAVVRSLADQALQGAELTRRFAGLAPALLPALSPGAMKPAGNALLSGLENTFPIPDSPTGEKYR